MEPIEIDISHGYEPFANLMHALHEARGEYQPVPAKRFYMSQRTANKLIALAPRPGGPPDYMASPRDTLAGIPVVIENELHDNIVCLITERIDNPAMPVTALRRPEPKPVPVKLSRWQRVRKFLRELCQAMRR